METDFTCIISPRHGHNTTIKSPLPYICSESSVSTTSTLSDANFHKHKNILLNYERSHPVSISKPLYRNHSETTMTDSIDIESYKQKLKSLNLLLSPIQLFHEIDLMIKNYNALKKEYCLQWELQQLYRQQIRSMLKQRKSNSNNSSFESDSYIMSLDNVEDLIKRLQNIQFSVNSIFHNFHNKKPPKSRIQKTNQNLNIVFTKSPRNINKSITPRQNIKSNTNRTSHSNIHPFSKRKKTKHKLKTESNAKKYNYINQYNSQCISPLKLTCNKNIGMVLPLPQSKSRRRSSIRSFGSLYSDKFRNSVAANYKNRMLLHDEFKHNNDDYLGLQQLKIVEFYRNDYIGQNELFETPFGIRPVIYCDWTASGKALNCVENYINTEVLPLYANTHTTTSITGVQTSKFRSEARSIIMESIGGNSNEDVIIFTGSGSTSSIYKMAHVLMKQNGYKPMNTVVFISIYEHNSNIFIWKELGCKIIVIPEGYNNNNGGLDLNILEKHLKFYTSKHMKHKYNLLIGSFTAASNVSGIIAPIDECTLLLHKYNALSFWDYATAGPYININMTNKQNHMLSKDAVFISTHKYLAGPGSPGILCAKKKLFLNYTPVVPGGGTVFVAYGVDDGQWEYLDNIEEREEGGTPDIIGSIRASFPFMIKDHLTTSFIEEKENEYLKLFFRECKLINNLVIMGNVEFKRLPVISFLITHTKNINGFGVAKKTKYLHYNFISVLMNDLFGIQGRGGCACAGMYGKYVLNMNIDQVDHIVDQLRNDKNELSRPGYYRINLHYTLSKEELNYIINAIKFVCKKGWLFLPLYDVDIESGNYFHRNIKFQKQLKSLLDITFNANQMKWKKKIKRNNNNMKLKGNLNKYFEIAENVIINLNEYLPNQMHGIDTQLCDGTAWYWLPKELYHAARNYIQ